MRYVGVLRVASTKHAAFRHRAVPICAGSRACTSADTPLLKLKLQFAETACQLKKHCRARGECRHPPRSGATSHMATVIIDEAAPGAASAVRGPSFSAEEDLLLARAWIRSSREGVDQDAVAFWSSCTSVLNKSLESQARARTPQSVRCRWTLVQRVAQKYLAARKAVLANVPSGEAPGEDEVREKTMTAYCYINKTKKGRAGETKLAPRVKFVQACIFLSSHPKFSAAIDGSRSQHAPPPAV